MRITNIIEAQEYAGKLAFGELHPKNIYEAFEIYEMIMDDYYYRQNKLIEKRIDKWYDENFVSAKDLALGDKNIVFYASSSIK